MIIMNKNNKVPREFLLDVLRTNMKEGIEVSLPFLELRDAEKRRQDALTILQEEFLIENPNSPDQLKNYAIRSGDKDIYECCFDQHKQKYSFAADNLAKLLERDSHFAIALKRFRDAKTIIDDLNMIKVNCDVHMRIHPTVSLQLTNRVNYIEPGLMTISKALLWKVIRPLESDWELWSVDVKNQEPWIFSHLIQDETLTQCVQEAYVNKKSFYKVVFEKVYGHPVENDYEYDEFKTSWNALTYGGTKQGLKARCKAVDGAAIYDFYTKLPGYKKYSAACWSKAAKGITKDVTYFGSTVECAANKATKAALARSLADIPIQGTAADILAFLVKDINANIQDNARYRGRFKIYFTRHDEIIFQVKRNPDETDEDIVNIFHDIADHMVDQWVPFMIDIERVY